VEQSDILRMETTGIPTVGSTHSLLFDLVAHLILKPKKNPFIMPSILTPDPSSMLAQNLALHGRTLDVVRAVTRDEAGKLKEAGEKIRQKADKRNMYLLREGGRFFIVPVHASKSQPCIIQSSYRIPLLPKGSRLLKWSEEPPRSMRAEPY
jgi:hypothetical protein